MAFTFAPSFYGVRIGYCDVKVPFLGSNFETNAASFCVSSHSGKSDVMLERRMLKMVDTRIVENSLTKSTDEIEIPVSCYKVTELVVLCLGVCVLLFNFVYLFIFSLTKVDEVK